MTTTTPSAKPKKPSSVRHTRAIARDRSKRPPVAPPAEQVSAHLSALIPPRWGKWRTIARWGCANAG